MDWFSCMKLGHWPKCQELHIYSLSLVPKGVEIELIFALRTVVSEVMANFQNSHIWAWNLAIGQKVPDATQCTSTLFLPQGVDKTRHWVYFRSMDSGFWHTGRFSNLSYLGMKLGHWPKCQKLHLYSLCTPWGQNWAYFYSTDSSFRDTGDFAIFGHETWQLPKVPEIVHILPKLPPSPKVHSVLLYGWPFPRYWQFCIFPLATMLNFNKKFKFEIPKLKEEIFVWIVTGNVQIKFRQKVKFSLS